ncbi:hypothetical protein QM565_01520 [Geitlerinema splendidum]|jgi:peroxiredoxin|nr:hypothetical protein [Geitlerinema splendidum]
MGNYRLEPGDAAPDFDLLDPKSNRVSLVSFWGSGPTLLTFLRHFG